ncbi:MAG: hypothetical protein V4584_01230 [Verrucomicrobiota bacterium]
MDETHGPPPGKTRRWKIAWCVVLAALAISLLIPTGSRIVALDLDALFAASPHEPATYWSGQPSCVVDHSGRKVCVGCFIHPDLATAHHFWIQEKRDMNHKGLRPTRPLGDDAFFDDGMAGPMPNLRFLRGNVMTQVMRDPRSAHAPTEALDRLELEEVARDFDAKLASYAKGVRSQTLFAALDICIQARLLFWRTVVRVFGVG